MFKFLTKINILHRLLLAFLLAAVIPWIAITLLGLAFVEEQGARGQAVQVNINASRASFTINAYLLRMNTLLNAAYREQYESGQNIAPAQIQENINRVQDEVDAADLAIQRYQQDYQLATSPRMKIISSLLTTGNAQPAIPELQQATLNQVDMFWQAYKHEQAQVQVALVKRVPAERLHPLLLNANDGYTQAAQAWSTVTLISQEVGDQIAQPGPVQSNVFLLAALVGLLSLILVVAVIGSIVYHTLTHPLRQLVVLLKRVTMGELHLRPEMTGSDEIYLLTSTITVMLENIVCRLHEAQAQRDIIVHKLEKLLSEVSGVVEGDLRGQATVTTDVLGVLGDAFNYMIEEFSSLIARVKNVAGEVEQSTKLLSRQMAQLMEAGNGQIEQIGTLEAEIERISAPSRRFTERAGNLYEVSRQAREDAHSGREAIEHSIVGIERVGELMRGSIVSTRSMDERWREIHELVENIISISHHTNCMALDAAVQAASTGEQCQGFAALAVDIRRMAERAKEEACTVSSMVRTLRADLGTLTGSMQDSARETGASAQSVREAGLALEAIFAVMDQQARELEHVNQAARLQIRSATTMAQQLKEISATTQQNGKSTHEAAQQMLRVGELIDQLGTSVAAFKLRQGLGAAISAAVSISNPQMEYLPPDSPKTVSAVFRAMNIDPRSASSSRGWYMPASSQFTPPPGYDPFAFTPMPGPPLPRQPRSNAHAESATQPGNTPQTQGRWTGGK